MTGLEKGPNIVAGVTCTWGDLHKVWGLAMYLYRLTGSTRFQAKVVCGSCFRSCRGPWHLGYRFRA